YVGTAVERETRYKVSGLERSESADRPLGEGERAVPERPVGVPSLRTERRVHDHHVRGPVPIRNVRDFELHRRIVRPSGLTGDRYEGRVDLDPRDGVRS